MVHAVTDDRVLALPDFLARAAAVASGPDVAIHLRGRQPADRLLRLADTLREITARSGSPLLINDRLDVAVVCGADGLHLPAAGLPTPRVRTTLGPGLLIGRSAHGAADAGSALENGADYVFLGNIWETPSHPGRRGLGLAVVSEVQPARVIAIGGVTPARAAAAARAGAAGVAGIRTLWDAPDPAAAARALRVSFA